METASWHRPQNIPTKYVDFPDHQDLRLELPRLSCHSLVKELYHPFVVNFFFLNMQNCPSIISSCSVRFLFRSNRIHKQKIEQCPWIFPLLFQGSSWWSFWRGLLHRIPLTSVTQHFSELLYIGTMYPALDTHVSHKTTYSIFLFAMEANLLFLSCLIKTCSQMFTFLFEMVLLVHCRTPHSLWRHSPLNQIITLLLRLSDFKEKEDSRCRGAPLPSFQVFKSLCWHLQSLIPQIPENRHSLVLSAP